jgi:membrane fusion protein, multidrug efflux system
VEQHPDYLEAEARVAEAERQLDHTTVHAPFAGIVTQVSSLQPGQYLGAATPAFALVSSDHVWVDAQPKETDLTHVKPGDPVTVTIDTYPDRIWTGVVASISPASGATFSVLPAQNSSGNWVKVVQRIPLRVRVEQPADAPQLRAGMSAVVSIDTGHVRHLSDIF